MSTYTSIKNLFIITVSILLFSACSRKISFATSTVVPAAEGEVVTKKDDNNNYTVEINIKNLAAPDRLTPPKNAYVVWLQSEATATKNVGQIVSSSGLFSNSLKASLRTVSASKPTRVFITAEESPNVTEPGSQIVLTTPEF